jgi:tripartite-type tricarboxylate transporter receptor subunit TctC
MRALTRSGFIGLIFSDLPTDRTTTMRLILPLFAALVSISLPLQCATANDYPNRTVRISMPFTAGGAPDLLVRLVAQKLSEKWGQPVLVENRPGGNTVIGTLAVTKSKPDGYTLLCSNDTTFVLNSLLYSSLPYSLSELEPIILMASIPHVLAVSSKVPASNVKELIALAKEQPDKLMYGTTGPGSIQRLATEYFSKIAGIKLVHVPYRGAPETTTAILAGQIDLTINGMSNIMPHVGGGKLKALAISTPKRSSLAPDMPTMQEAGVPGYSSQGTFGLVAPVGTPPEVREKIRADVAEILARPDVKATLEKQSFAVENGGPAEFAKVIGDDTVKWRQVIKDANIKVE